MSAATMFAQHQQNLIRVGAAQKDLRPRFLSFAADFFRQIADGEKPTKPDKFIAEVTAEIIAESVGGDVPLPLEDAGAAKRRAEGRPLPTDPIVESPEARAWLESHGMKNTQAKTRLVVSFLMQNPTTWFRSPEIADRLNRSRTGVSVLLQKLREAGIVESEGERNQCRWKFAEMPRHV